MNHFFTKSLIAMTALTVSCAAPSEKEGIIGKSTIEITDGKMTPEILVTLSKVSGPEVSPDGNKILYTVGYTGIAQNRGNSEIFVMNADGTGRTQLTKDEANYSNVVWLDGGKKIAYLSDGQVWTAEYRDGERPSLGKTHKITDVDGGIAQFKLSPDEKSIMFTHYVQSYLQKPSDTYPDLDKARAYRTEDLMYRHWDHWVEEIPHTFIARMPEGSKRISLEDATDLLAGEKELYELPTEPFSGIEQLSWSPDGTKIAYSCRKLAGKAYAFSTNTDIYLYDIATAGCTNLSEGMMGYDTEPVWSPDGSRLAWLSMERDGYEADKVRLMVMDMATGRITELTGAFKYNASSPVWSEDGGRIYFASLAEGLQALFVADMEGNITRITSDRLWYDFMTPAYVKENGKGAEIITSYMSMLFPTEIVAIDWDGTAQADTVSQLSFENKDILDRLDTPVMEDRWMTTVDGKKMLTWVMYPPHFDPSKVYPAIEILLGGPQSTLSQAWSYRWNYRLMAQQGYIVIMPNRRGTTAFGQEWCEQISKDYCGLNMQDYLTAAHEMQKESYVGKMAACGASYGGFSVYYMAGNHNKTYDCFIAHAGIFNQEHMYMTTEELWFPTWDNGGAPWDENPAAKRHYAHSAHKFIKNWDTPIMVMHGGMDFRVPVDQGMAAYNAAQLMGIPSRLVVFPEENHWILKPQNAVLWHREYFSWLDRWLKDE
ncbi:hypothetical protein B5F83_05745 [Muribaculum sp. An289]|uniref:S9 family peptidase n=1 Tax=unclassified Muribaculum TaxID=2622126 RepID=UPI000B3AE892|nr:MULTISPECIES: S9 family peptidase [unclassified Muribaculum]OUO37259.1 hypothetical protein B5F83_05745 [Muribaculum sp. An289]OUO43098.1 hypothetical protein B5F81_04820 [Muribaculum sp. An287]